MPRPHSQPARPDPLAELERIYAQLPVMANCRGLCAYSCSSLGQTSLEQRYVRERTGVDLPLVHAGPGMCPALTMLNRCSVYEARPIVCRLWGMTQKMECRYGCEPEGGLIPKEQAHEFMLRVWRLSRSLPGGNHLVQRPLGKGERHSRE